MTDAATYTCTPKCECICDFSKVTYVQGVAFKTKNKSHIFFTNYWLKVLINSHTTCYISFWNVIFMNKIIWENLILERNVPYLFWGEVWSGFFPHEWRSHEWGKKNFPMSHERYISIPVQVTSFPHEWLSRRGEKNSTTSGNSRRGEKIFHHEWRSHEWWNSHHAWYSHSWWNFFHHAC